MINVKEFCTMILVLIAICFLCTQFFFLVIFFNLSFYSLEPHFCVLIFFKVFYKFYNCKTTVCVFLYTHTYMSLCV